MEHRLARLTAATALVVLAACSSPGGMDNSTASTKPTSDQGRADYANLKVTDFPTEWKSTPVPAETTAANAANERAFAQCMGRRPPDEDRTVVVYSPDFSAADTRRVASSVQLAKTIEIAQADFQAQRGDKAVGCQKSQLESEFRRQLPTAAPQLTVDRLDIPLFGDEVVAFRADVTSVAEGVQVRTLIDMVFVRKGRTEISASFVNRTSPFPQDLQRSLLQRMVGRA